MVEEQVKVVVVARHFQVVLAAEINFGRLVQDIV
ncbi:MAG: hypothetical protein RL237_880 [Actinomycetota bacterium]